MQTALRVIPLLEGRDVKHCFAWGEELCWALLHRFLMVLLPFASRLAGPAAVGSAGISVLRVQGALGPLCFHFWRYEARLGFVSAALGALSPLCPAQQRCCGALGRLKPSGLCAAQGCAGSCVATLLCSKPQSTAAKQG